MQVTGPFHPIPLLGEHFGAHSFLWYHMVTPEEEAGVGAVYCAVTSPWGWGCDWHWGTPPCVFCHRVTDSLKYPIRVFVFFNTPPFT